MKQFLFIAALFVLFSQAVFARVPITIKNNTGCDINVRIRGNVNGTPCTNVYVSAPITIPPLGSVFYNDPTTTWVPGGLNCACAPPSLGINDLFTAVEILDRGTGCGPATTLGFVGIPCSGFPPCISTIYGIGWNLSCMWTCNCYVEPDECNCDI